MPHAITVRYLVKTIARTHGPYLDRLKQNVISRITHRYSPVPKKIDAFDTKTKNSASIK